MKRPWNRLNVPVYSLATTDGTHTNMNICTYVTPITLQPKQYAIAVYKNTKTLQNVQSHPNCILQTLTVEHLNLIRRFGQHSGLHKPKKLPPNIAIGAHNIAYITNVHSIIILHITNIHDVGDHMLAIAQVTGYKNIFDSPPLYLDTVRQHKLIRG